MPAPEQSKPLVGSGEPESAPLAAPASLAVATPASLALATPASMSPPAARPRRSTFRSPRNRSQRAALRRRSQRPTWRPRPRHCVACSERIASGAPSSIATAGVEMASRGRATARGLEGAGPARCGASAIRRRPDTTREMLAAMTRSGACACGIAVRVEPPAGARRTLRGEGGYYELANDGLLRFDEYSPERLTIENSLRVGIQS